MRVSEVITATTHHSYTLQMTKRVDRLDKSSHLCGGERVMCFQFSDIDMFIVGVRG